MSRLLDPEWNANAEAGEIVSALSQVGEKIKALVERLSLSRKPEAQVLKRGTIELRQLSDSFVASYEPEGREVEINGKTIPPKPGNQIRGVGKDPYQALIRLAGEIKKAEAFG